ncbi:MAG: hypothetical protein PWQ55_241 [Chloroflexota bacterium]|nr:hypothetical protein [Chloroflexota bacterium]
MNKKVFGIIFGLLAITIILQTIINIPNLPNLFEIPLTIWLIIVLLLTQVIFLELRIYKFEITRPNLVIRSIGNRYLSIIAFENKFDKKDIYFGGTASFDKVYLPPLRHYSDTDSYFEKKIFINYV